MENDKVLVDKDDLPRCGWCGTYYSHQWIRLSYEAPVFCSPECAAASTTETSDISVKFLSWLFQFPNLRYLFVSLILLSFILLFVLPMLAVIWIGLQLLSLCCLCSDYQSSVFRNNIQIGLERKDMFRDGYHLELECQFCSHLNPPEISDCRHCGASLKDSISVKRAIPEWYLTSQSSLDTKTRIGKCPHCAAVYSYGLADAVKCQNCGQQFKLIERNDSSN